MGCGTKRAGLSLITFPKRSALPNFRAFLAAMIANDTAAGSIGTAISIATGNSLEALVGAALIIVWSNGRCLPSSFGMYVRRDGSVSCFSACETNLVA